MTDEFRNQRKDPTEGVRIIGAEEAAEALERDDVAKRRPHHEKRFGDRPEAPPEDGPRPAIRFPLSQTEDASGVERHRSCPRRPRRGDTSMPHWTEPRHRRGTRGSSPRTRTTTTSMPGRRSPSSQPRWRGEGILVRLRRLRRLLPPRRRRDPCRRARPEQASRPRGLLLFDEFERGGAAPASPRPISSDPAAARPGPAPVPRAAYERPAGPAATCRPPWASAPALLALLLILSWFGPRTSWRW